MLAAALSLLLVAAQAQPDRNCTDDRGLDRCAASSQQQMRTLYGVQSIEELAASRAEVRRIFYVDGYGRDMVMIAFVRAPGGDPTVWIHHPQREGEERYEPLHAPVPLAVWNEVIEQSANFHRSFSDPRGMPRLEEDGAMTLCLHSWVYVMEAVDRPRGDSPAPIRQKTENACGNGPGEAFAAEIDRTARSLFPHCAALNVEQYRNEAAALAACRILRGDRVAAAEVLNRADAFVDVGGPQDARLIAGLFDSDATMSWGGEDYAGHGSEADEFWAAQMQAGEGRTNFYIQSVEGVNADHVRLIGGLWRSTPDRGGQAGRDETATVEQVWTRIGGGEWLVERAVIGPWVVRREEEGD